MDLKKTLLLSTCGAIVAASALVGAFTHATAASPSPLSLYSEYEAMGYSGQATDNPVAKLAARMKDGETHLEYKGERGYLDSFLEALDIDPSSQVLVYSKTSLQHPWISAKTPRAVYFNDDTYVGWVQGTRIIEVATMDTKLGAVFYVFHNAPDVSEHVERKTHSCLNCHDTYGNMGGGVPELMVSSYLVNKGGKRLTEDFGVDQTTDGTPLADRWGGWYVTGQHGSQTHLGNILIDDAADLGNMAAIRHGNVDSLDELGFLDTDPYLTDTSDIVALMVMEHQISVHNELTYVKFKAPVVLRRMDLDEAVDAASWDALPQTAQRVLTRMLDELVQRMLFVDAIELTDPISGSPDYASWFLSHGPRDQKGRSLRELDLETRLFKHRLSFVIYSDDFDTLPAYAKDYVYGQLANILRGRNREAAYAHLSETERQTILDILTATKPDFSAYIGGRAD